jgi:hypothetical protein
MQNDPPDPTEPLARALASTRTVLAQVKAGQLDAPTPCASWDVRALTGHFTGTAYWAATTISGIEAPEPEGDPGGDFVAAGQTAIKPGYRSPEGVGLFGPERPAPADRLAAFPGRAV